MLNFNTMPSVGRMAVVATSILGLANAHMYLAEPTPMEGNAIKNPLDASGSNWPCHGAALPTSGGQKLTAGQSFPLKLETANGQNTAAHGGGSCQLAILDDVTKAKDPNAWKVIYSIEGGCVANAAGNLSPGYKDCTTSGQSECTHTWDIPVPKGVKSGNAILSWTWFNTVGNREMYQNCVNVDIEGGSGDGQFPPLFVANLASVNDLHTTEGSDVLFPEPGQFVTTMSATDGGKNWPKATVGAAAGGGQGSPSSYAAPSATSAPAYSAPASSAPAYSAPPNIQSSIASYDNQKGRETQTTFATSVAATQSAVAFSAAPAPTGYSNSQGSNNASSDSQPCSQDGALICIGSDSFGICDHGNAVAQPLAQGTTCSSGVISGANRFRRHFHGAHKH